MSNMAATYNANEVPSFCLRFGLREGSRDEAFSGKYKYMMARLLELTNQGVLEIARKMATEEGDEGLIDILASIAPQGAPRMGGFQAPRRAYYAERTGKHPTAAKIDLPTLKTLYMSEYNRWSSEGYFQEYFGMSCVDVDFIPGALGRDIKSKILFSLNKDDLWPFIDRLLHYSEDDLFSVIEFIFDHISKPLTGHDHQYNQCGMHWETFNSVAGQTEYRASVNTLLARYGNGYELTPTGEVVELGPPGTTNLLEIGLPIADHNVSGRVDAAIKKFRQRQSTTDDRRDAVRDLADVLEYLRPKVKEVLVKKDEGALFTIANEFGIRHHTEKQQTDYDPAIWLSWMFYFYLSTIHAVVRLIEKGRATHAS